MFTYQKTNRYFAKTSAGMEQLSAEELLELGASETDPSYRGVYFIADRETLYRINYLSRLPTRILAPLLTFDCHSTDYLYKTARAIPWPELLRPDETFAVFSDVSNSLIKNARYASLRLKDAIVDRFRDQGSARPNVDTRDPGLWINLHIHANRAAISLDTAGGSLHRRGYRKEGLESPMQETLAAAIVRLSEWDGERPLYDPMCGSGTLLGEALMRQCRIPAGFLRKRFGFEKLPDYDAAVWRKVKREADAAIRDLPAGLIAGSDESPEAIPTARRNLSALPQGEKVKLERGRFQDLPGLPGRCIVCNPPYGIRCGKGSDLSALLRQFGDFLKKRCAGSTAFIYYGEPGLLRSLGLKPSWKRPLRNAELDGRLAKYELY